MFACLSPGANKCVGVVMLALQLSACGNLKQMFFKEVVIKVEGMAVSTLFTGHSITICK